jgi:hypothetical protein
VFGKGEFVRNGEMGHFTACSEAAENLSVLKAVERLCTCWGRNWLRNRVSSGTHSFPNARSDALHIFPEASAA